MPIYCHFQASVHAVLDTRSFDHAEKAARGDESEKGSDVLSDITYPHFTVDGSACYDEYPATVTFMYALYGLFALTSLVSAEMTIHDHHLLPSSSIDSTGQVIALVIVGVTVLRAVWLFVFLFSYDKSKLHGFYWPFNLKLFTMKSTQRFIHAPNFKNGPSSLPLGSLLSDAQSPFDSQLGYPVAPGPGEEHEDINKDWNKTTITQLNQSLHAPIPGVFSLEVAEMKTRFFVLKSEYLRSCILEVQRRNAIDFETDIFKFYVIVSMRIALLPGMPSIEEENPFPVRPGDLSKNKTQPQHSRSLADGIAVGYAVQQLTIGRK